MPVIVNYYYTVAGFTQTLTGDPPDPGDVTALNASLNQFLGCIAAFGGPGVAEVLQTKFEDKCALSDSELFPGTLIPSPIFCSPGIWGANHSVLPPAPPTCSLDDPLVDTYTWWVLYKITVTPTDLFTLGDTLGVPLGVGVPPGSAGTQPLFVYRRGTLNWKRSMTYGNKQPWTSLNKGRGEGYTLITAFPWFLPRGVRGSYV